MYILYTTCASRCSTSRLPPILLPYIGTQYYINKIIKNEIYYYAKYTTVFRWYMYIYIYYCDATLCHLCCDDEKMVLSHSPGLYTSWVCAVQCNAPARVAARARSADKPAHYYYFYYVDLIDSFCRHEYPPHHCVGRI